MLSALAKKVLGIAAAQHVQSLVDARRWPGRQRSVLEALESRVLLSRAAGIDVSQWQGTIDWNQVRAAGKEFAFVRATIGGSTDSDNLDTKFLTNMPAAATAGVLAGAYHHAKPDTTANDAVNEANWFLSNAGQYMGGGWLRPVLVIEEGDALSVSALSQWVNTFSDTIESAKGVDPVIYTNSSYARFELDTSVNVHDLWLARPISGSTDPQTGDPETPPGYPNPYGVWNEPTPTSSPSHYVWDFWQHSFTGSVPGISGNVDLDVYHGDRASLEANFLIPPSGSFQGVGINFGTYETPIPSGYINFGDQLFGNVFGYQMGWSDAGTDVFKLSGGPDERYNTYAMPNDFGGISRSFEVAVPNGSYRVRIVAGSPTEYGNTHKFLAESQIVVNGVNNSVNHFLSGVTTVNVEDGRLTISSDSGAAPFSRLTFVDIVAASQTGALPAAPSAVSVMPASSTSMDVRWIDNADNEGRDPATFSSSTWGQVNEGYKIERSEFDNGVWSAWSAPLYVRGNAELYHDTGLTPQKQYKYRVTAINAAGASDAVESAGVATLASTGKQANTPTGDPWQVPSRIQAEDFDRGGEGTSYHDLSSGSAGGFYREGDMDVGRIGTPGTGAPLLPREHRVGWFRAGEWLEYSIDVPVARTYTMDFRISAPGSGGKFHASSTQGGVETNLAASAPGGQWDVPNTGDWNAFQMVSKAVDLPVGVQVIRVYADQNIAENPGVMDFDWFQLTPTVTISGDTSVQRGATYSLSLSSSNPAQHPIDSWQIDWGDGTQSNIGNLSSISHVYRQDGDRTITATASGSDGTYAANSLAVTVTLPPQTPFGGTAWPVPGLIEHEDFDTGGEGVAYHDIDHGNTGGFYRRGEDVDVDIARDDNGSYVIGWAKAGEWLEYTVNVQTTGTYTLSTYVSSPGSGGEFHWEVDGLDVTGTLAVPNTGGYYNYQPVTVTGISLSAGTHVLSLSLDTGGSAPGWTSVGNFNYFTLTDTTAALTAPTGLAATPAFPTRVDLVWSDSNVNESGFKIERSDNGGSTWTQIATVRANTTRYADTGLTPGGSYTYRVRATNDGGDSAYSGVSNAATTALTVSFPIKVNFQVNQTPPIPGYKTDSGELFGDRGDGLSYGWNVDERIQDRERGVHADRRLDTLIHFKFGAKWQMELPNGTYDVTVSIGDPAYPSSHTINVNGIGYWTDEPLAASQFLQKTLTVEVTDGFVTIDQGFAHDRATRINYVEIATANPAAPVVEIRPSVPEATESPLKAGQFIVTRSGPTAQTLEVGYTISGSATGADYSETLTGIIAFGVGQSTAIINITPINEGIEEPDELLTLSLNDGGAAYTLGSRASASIVIRDASSDTRPVLSVVATDPYASEEGPDLAKFTITRTGSLANDVVVPFWVRGSASPADYSETWVGTGPWSGSASVTIPQGSNTVEVTITPIDDHEDERTESVLISLAVPSGYFLGTPNSASIKILDNEIPDPDGDDDNDGLTNQEEFDLKTDPWYFDSDGDLLPDGFENENNPPFDPLNPDQPDGDEDGDGSTNLDESNDETDPTNPDTDGDGTNDGDENDIGGDPNDPNDGGQPPADDMKGKFKLTVGDPSGSRSERWALTVGNKTYTAPGYGQVGSRDYDFKAGQTYPITMRHVGTDPEFAARLGGPNYDWTANVSAVGTGLPYFIDDAGNLLRTQIDGTIGPPNETEGQISYLHIPLLDVDVDSDNSGSIEHSDAEDRWEQSARGAKHIWFGTPDLTPLVLSLSSNLTEAGASSTDITFPAYDSNLMTLWNGSNVILPGATLSASTLGLSPGGSVTLHVEALDASNGAMALEFLADVTGSEWSGLLRDTIHLNVRNGVDLRLDSDNDGSITDADDEVEEDAPGAVITGNFDDDDGSLVPDYLDSGTVVGEDDLVPMEIVVSPFLTSGTLTLSIEGGEDLVKVWLDKTKSGAPIIDGTALDFDEDWTIGSQPDVVYLEVLEASASPGDIVFLLSAPPVPGSTQPSTDRGVSTGSAIDLDLLKVSHNQAPNDPGNELGDEAEVKIGAYVPINNDDDDYSATARDPFGSDLKPGRNDDENDLLPVVIRKVPNAQQVKVKYVGNVRGDTSRLKLYADKNKETPIDNLDAIDLPANQDHIIYVEGRALGSANVILLDPTTNKPISAPVKINVFKWEGPLNVPQHGTFQYKAQGVQGGKWITPEGGTIVEGQDSSDIKIAWDAGPIIGKAVYQASADYVWDLAVNVVKIEVATPAGQQQSFAVLPAPNIVQGNDTAKQKVVKAKSKAIQWQAQVTFVGPEVDGVQRGVKQMRAGFVQNLNVTTFRADYGDATQTVSAKSPMEGTKYWDARNRPGGKYPDSFYSVAKAAIYGPQNDQTTGVIAEDDAPFGGPPRTFGGHLLKRMEMVYDFDLFVAVVTVDKRAVIAGKQVHVGQAKANWRFDASGTIDPGFAWTLTGTGVTPPQGGWEAVNATVQPKTDGPRFNDEILKPASLNWDPL